MSSRFDVRHGSQPRTEQQSTTMENQLCAVGNDNAEGSRSASRCSDQRINQSGDSLSVNRSACRLIFMANIGQVESGAQHVAMRLIGRLFGIEARLDRDPCGTQIHGVGNASRQQCALCPLPSVFGQRGSTAHPSEVTAHEQSTCRSGSFSVVSHVRCPSWPPGQRTEPRIKPFIHPERVSQCLAEISSLVCTHDPYFVRAFEHVRLCGFKVKSRYRCFALRKSFSRQPSV